MQEQNEQIGRNSQKFVRNSCEIRTKFVRILYEVRTNFTFPEYSHKFIHVKFVRNSYEIRTNFVRISREFRPICQETKQIPKQAHLALAWAGDAPCPGLRALERPPRWDRVHQLPQRGRPLRGGNASHGEVHLRLRIDIVPLADLLLVQAAHEEQHALLAVLDDGEVGGRGRPGEEGGVEGARGGACRDRLGGVGKEGLGSIPLPQPHPPNRPLHHPQHLVHAGEVPAGQIPSNIQGLLGGGGVHVCGVALVVFVSGVGGPQVKNSPLQPILGVGEGRQSMMAARNHHQQHVPPMQLNGVPARLPRLPKGRPRLQRHLVVL